jgi:hypothetical protein
MEEARAHVLVRRVFGVVVRVHVGVCVGMTARVGRGRVEFERSVEGNVGFFEVGGGFGRTMRARSHVRGKLRGEKGDGLVEGVVEERLSSTDQHRKIGSRLPSRDIRSVRIEWRREKTYKHYERPGEPRSNPNLPSRRINTSNDPVDASPDEIQSPPLRFAEESEIQPFLSLDSENAERNESRYEKAEGGEVEESIDEREEYGMRVSWRVKLAGTGQLWKGVSSR